MGGGGGTNQQKVNPDFENLETIKTVARQRRGFKSSANQIITANRINNKNSKLAEAGRKFASETSAHGFSHITSEDRHWSYRVLWILIMFCAIGFFGWMTLTRINQYYESKGKITYTTTFKRAGENGMPLPSISICSEAFHNEFLVPELMLETEHIIDFYSAFKNFGNFSGVGVKF